MTSAVATSSSTWNVSRAVSLAVRPRRNDARAMGSDRKRSIMPVFMSSAMPMPDCTPVNVIVWMITAGTTKSL
jgi:hypothetical protein